MIMAAWGCSSAGEHLVRNEGATGSIPVTSTISNNAKLFCHYEYSPYSKNV